MVGSKYGQQRRKKPESKGARRFVPALIAVWATLVFSWGAGRIAAAFDYHPALGEPLFQAFGRPWYRPWKVLTWGEELGAQYPAIQRIVDQTYLAAVGVPMLLVR